MSGEGSPDKTAMVSPLAPADSIFTSFNAAYEAFYRSEAYKGGDMAECPKFTSSLKRLRWSLDGPLTTAISVMADPDDEPYYQPSPLAAPSHDGTSASGTWHPISRESLIEPKLSSLDIRCPDLSRWEENWLEAHEGHWCPEYEETLGRDIEPDPTRTRIGPLPYEDPDLDPDDCAWDEEGGHEAGHLLMCCGEERPMNTKEDPRLQLVIRPKEGGAFLTVHDFVEQVHFWLMGLREEIRKALVVSRAVCGEPPFPEDARLMVYARDRYVDVGL